MNISDKYGRTYHYPYSPGTTSDDRINHEYWDDLIQIKEVAHTEKLDGENTCFKKIGIFSRSHAAPSRHPWVDYLKPRWELFKNDLKTLEIFGENLYAIHSIEYKKLDQHFYVFAVRDRDMWLSWEEVKFYAAMLDFPTVPLIQYDVAVDEENYKKNILDLTKQSSAFESYDIHSGEPCSMEGTVTRNIKSFPVASFKRNVFKWVRKNHVSTDEHWSRTWRRAPLIWEKPGN